MTACIIETRIIDERIGKEFPLPTYATAGAAGMDLRACLEQPLCLVAGATHLVGSGIAISIRDVGYMAMLAPRSGLGVKHGIVLANTVGIIDSDYQNEIRVALHNRSTTDYTVQPGERICQLVIVPVVQATLKVVETFGAETARGLAGFGSTGQQ
ncbi:MAG: dUTP diphosphatase [Proteobacteria bacterium]|nr:dUTP diphosphatase [Pseudomonadota bacterium]MCH9758221.1 dUTP diphosphatase [Pseudomonadota bacterium]